MPTAINPTDIEVFFDKNEIIVSKTDPQGRITYANKVFCKVAGYTEKELLGQPHSLIRHPDMPRAVFKLLWDTLGEGQEVFAYVKNLTKRGDFYWVFAHVTPSLDDAGNLVGYHSSRRVPNRQIVQSSIVPLYAELLREEMRHRNGKEALAAGFASLVAFLKSKNMKYDELVFSL